MKLSKMVTKEDEKEVDNILYNTYAFEDFDKQDIINRLNCLVPQNMYVIFKGYNIISFYKI